MRAETSWMVLICPFKRGWRKLLCLFHHVRAHLEGAIYDLGDRTISDTEAADSFDLEQPRIQNHEK